MGQASSGVAKRFSSLLAVAVVLLLVLAVYNAVELSVSQSQIASLQQQNFALQQDIFDLHGQVGALQEQLSSLTRSNTQTTSFRLQSACLSVNNGCSGNSYVIILDNNGFTAVPSGYSVFLAFKDATKGTYFGFNTTVPGNLPPGQGATLFSPSWPSGSNATAKLFPGDEVGVAVDVGSFEATIGTRVLTCSTYGFTTTFANYTQTSTVTTTTQTCS